MTHSLQIYCIELTGLTSLYTLGLGANNMSLQCQSILNTYLVIIDQDVNKFFIFFPMYIVFNHKRLLFVFISVVGITSEIEIACFDLVKNIIT